MRERGLLVDARALRQAGLRAALLFLVMTLVSLSALVDLRLYASLVSVAALLAGTQVLVAGCEQLGQRRSGLRGEAIVAAVLVAASCGAFLPFQAVFVWTTVHDDVAAGVKAVVRLWEESSVFRLAHPAVLLAIPFGLTTWQRVGRTPQRRGHEPSGTHKSVLCGACCSPSPSRSAPRP